MTRPNELQQLDEDFAAGRLSAEDYRRREELVRAAANERQTAGAPQEASPFPPAFRWETSSPEATTQVMQAAGQNTGERVRPGPVPSTSRAQATSAACSSPSTTAPSTSQRRPGRVQTCPDRRATHCPTTGRVDAAGPRGVRVSRAAEPVQAQPRDRCAGGSRGGAGRRGRSLLPERGSTTDPLEQRAAHPIPAGSVRADHGSSSAAGSTTPRPAPVDTPQALIQPPGALAAVVGCSTCPGWRAPTCCPSPS